MNKIVQKLIIIIILCFSMSSAKAVPLAIDGGWQNFLFPGLLNLPPGVDPSDPLFPWDTSFEFTLTQPGLLTVQDVGIPLDLFQVFDQGLFILETSGPSGNAFPVIDDPDVAALNPDFSRGSILLGIGEHVITGGERNHSTDGGGGAFIRVDTVAVTEPSIPSLLILGLLIFYYKQFMLKNKQQKSFVI